MERAIADKNKHRHTYMANTNIESGRELRAHANIILAMSSVPFLCLVSGTISSIPTTVTSRLSR
jgi:hypothetical protein